jgi:hypothetical protein
MKNDISADSPATPLPGKQQPLLPRGAKLRRALLNQITPIAYRDPFKDKELTAVSILAPMVEQKLGQFITLLEPLISKSPDQTKR